VVGESWGSMLSTCEHVCAKHLLCSAHASRLCTADTCATCRDVLLEYFSSIGNDGPAEEAARLRSRAREALLALGQSEQHVWFYSC
jgi:hypothetical protein